MTEEIVFTAKDSDELGRLESIRSAAQFELQKYDKTLDTVRFLVMTSLVDEGGVTVRYTPAWGQQVHWAVWVRNVESRMYPADLNLHRPGEERLVVSSSSPNGEKAREDAHQLVKALREFYKIRDRYRKLNTLEQAVTRGIKTFEETL